MGMDMKLALATLERIISENVDNKNIIFACQMAIEEIKTAIKIHHLDEEKHTSTLEITELFGLFRTRIMITLLRDVNRFGENEQQKDESFTLLLGIVEEKINSLQERKENVENEKDIRR